MSTILEAFKKLNEDNDVPVTNTDDVELEQARKEFELAIKEAGGVRGKIEVTRVKDKILYMISYEETIEGNELFYWTEVEPEEWEDADEDGQYGGVNASFNEDNLMEYWLNKLMDSENLEDGFEYTIYKDEDDDDGEEVYFDYADVESDYDNEITVDSYLNDPGDYWDPGSSEFELGGKFKMTATFYFTKR